MRGISLAAGRWVCLALVVGLLASLAPGTAVARVQEASDGVVPGQFIVVVNPGNDPGQVAASHSAAPLHVYRVAARGFAARLSPAQVDKLRADPRVNNVVPDRYVSAFDKPDGVGKGGGGGSSTAEVIPEGVQRIGAPDAWSTTTGAGVGVAIIDTGIDFNHADLNPVETECFTAFTSCQDDNGHGTHVAGIVGARHNNGQGVVGVAPAAKLYSVKVLDRNGSGTWSGIVAGIEWVTEPPGEIEIKVANMSLGGSGSDTDNCGVDAVGTVVDPLHNAICNSVNAGVTYVVAAGNDPNKEISQMVPAAYPEVMAVASTTAVDGANACKFFSGAIQADTASYFTTDGVGVAVSAPGEDKEDITKGCMIKSVGILSTKLGGGTTRMSGTSMASPHVAGVVALMLEDATLTPAAVRGKIKDKADRKGVAPLDNPASSYTPDGVLEGIVWAPGAIAP